jgi:UrcA family protein
MMKISIAMFGCLALTFAFEANAAQPLSPPSATVRYHAVDLTNPAQVQDLYRRIKFAARSVCPQYTVPDLERVQILRACIDTAMANAVESVDHPSLTALHEGVSRVRLASRGVTAG